MFSYSTDDYTRFITRGLQHHLILMSETYDVCATQVNTSDAGAFVKLQLFVKNDDEFVMIYAMNVSYDDKENWYEVGRKVAPSLLPFFDTKANEYLNEIEDNRVKDITEKTLEPYFKNDKMLEELVKEISSKYIKDIHKYMREKEDKEESKDRKYALTHHFKALLEALLLCNIKKFKIYHTCIVNIDMNDSPVQRLTIDFKIREEE